MAIDNLDPFAEKEDEFRTNDIKKSKSRLTRRRVDALKKSREAENGNPKKLPFSKRSIKFFKELPEREDKRNMYLRLSLILILIATIGTSLFFLIDNWNKNRNQKIEEVKAEIESAHTDFFLGNLNEEEDLENYKLEIEKKYSSTNDPDLKFLYRKELISLYFEDEEKNQEVIRLINEQLSYKKLTTQEKVNLLVAVIDLYRANDMTNELENALSELLDIPDDGEMTFGGETLTELKARVKNENS